MRYILSICFLSFIYTLAYAQELNCTVHINSDQIEGSNKSIFQTLEQSITEVLNQTRWTQMTFSAQEKIDCSMQIIVQKVENNIFSCEMTVQARRPVYATSYFTPLMNFRDQNFHFAYQEFDRIEIQQTHQLTTNLAALLAYYAYLIIGHDCDSYSKLGGTPYFQLCEDIVSSAQSVSFESSEMTGWKAFDSNRNRYALINNLMDGAFQEYREFYYTYHRLCLDQMTQNLDNARARIAAGLPVLRDANRARPATYIINTFLDAKADELVHIFEKSPAQERKEVYQVLMDIDPTRDNLYSALDK